jgi:predicted glycoside hydrolase/deacetylase ChbG (UPF0249 family)
VRIVDWGDDLSRRVFPVGIRKGEIDGQLPKSDDYTRNPALSEHSSAGHGLLVDDDSSVHSASTAARFPDVHVHGRNFCANTRRAARIPTRHKGHPDADFGLHLTLTSERVYYRWGPVAPADKVPGLVDQNGYFHHDWEENKHINAKEVEIELRAQVERALAMGVRPTHLDSHQYRLIMNGKELFDVMLRVAHEYRLPVFVTRDWFADHPYLQASLDPGDIVLDHTVTIEPGIPPEKWAEFYVTALKNLKPGVTEFVIHPGYDDDELRAATRERSTWGSAWRQRDYDFFTSDQFREILAQQNIKLITWRELAQAAKPK